MAVKDAYYRLAAGIDVVPLGDGSILFRSDVLAIRVEGASATLLKEQILPLLDGTHKLSDVARRIPEVGQDDLRTHLDALVDAGVLRRSDEEETPLAKGLPTAPFLRVLDTLGVTKSRADEVLGRLRIAVVGIEAHGAHLASLLARHGVGRLLLVDPYPCQPEDLGLTAHLSPDAVGYPRADALKVAMGAGGTTTEIVSYGSHPLTREQIFVLAPQCDMMISCFDKGFSSAHHWVNQASLAEGIPALYGQVHGRTATVGPLVLPGQTACYMCWRMRSLACEDDFDQAMTHEEFLDQLKRPTLHERGVFPTLAPYAGSLMAQQVITHFLALSVPSLAGRVQEFDALTLQTQTHSVLQRPDCRACRKKGWERVHPTADDLKESRHRVPPGDPLSAGPFLISGRTGIVRNFQQVPKDPSEPARPHIFRAELANHRFLGKADGAFPTCSGKGMTPEDAKRSALGEAVERYSGGSWVESEILYARRGEIAGDAVDPRELVLYEPEQYGQLPYAPYADSTVLGWVGARSLITNHPVHVPALAVLMHYEVRSPEEFLCPVTSNGLAAGPTLLEAVLAATFEVLERDAFMITWLNRLPCTRLDSAGHPDPIVSELCRTHERRGVQMELYRIPTDHPVHVLVALGVQMDGGDGPGVVVGLGADLDARRAARKAILEVAQVRPALRARMRHPETRRRMEELVADPHRVATLEDHDLLYASSRSTKAFDFLRQTDVHPFDWGEPASSSPVDNLDRLVDYFRSSHRDWIYCNLTPPDMEALGLHTARVIIPGFQPIDFGWTERRLGGERLFDLPVSLGLRAARATLAQLNPDPHPIS